MVESESVVSDKPSIDTLLGTLTPQQLTELAQTLRKAKLLDYEPIVLRDVRVPNKSVTQQNFWLISKEAFSTVVDSRDAASEAEAIHVARTDALQAWYINGHLADAITVKQVSRNEYIDWLKRGVS